jgi:hypothetical protein
MSVAKNLVAGRILEDQLFPYPDLRAKDQEVLRLMVDAIDQYLSPKHQDFKRWDRDAQQPAEFIQGLRDLGLFGLIVPEEYGGLGLSNAGYARVLSQSSSHDSSVSLTIGAHSSIGMKGLLLFGTGTKGPLFAEAGQRRNDCGVLSHRVGSRLRCSLDSHASGQESQRHVDLERREDLDHQRRHCGPVHRVRTHVICGGQDNRISGGGGVAGRPAWAA